MTPAVPTRDGATVMLVRDGDHAERPLEVFMLRRHPSTAFGSVHVFPGGVVDAGDHGPALDAFCPGLTDAAASTVLDVPTGGRAFWVAAMRESFEEAGVLLARHADGAPVRFDHHPEVEARFEEHRRALRAGTRSLLDVLLAEQLVLAVDEVRYFSHWITPEGSPKRFDTRFFLARAPEGQAYIHDDEELIGSEWVRPADALARQRSDDFAMIEPTIRSLEEIGAFATTDQLLGQRSPATRAAFGRSSAGAPSLASEARVHP
jgi:8-oxo-dGTP pyrophosphatase MutT (NUDIX family)